MLVDHDVKTQDLKAHAVVQVLWLARLIKMGEEGLADQKRFY